MIHYNDPKYQQERANVKPLSVEEIQQCIDGINQLIHNTREYTPYSQDLSIIANLQRLIWDYENLQHMRETYEAALKNQYNEGFEKGHAYAVNTYIK